MKKRINDFVWFWRESKKFTGYTGFKLLREGIKPCIKFMKLQKESI